MKRGIVIEGRGSQVRVQFEDNDGVISPWLDVVQSSTKGTKVYRRPKAGSMVLCDMDKNWETGSVIGALYSEADPAPGDSDGLMHVEFGDGTVLSYDEAGGALNISLASGLQLAMSGTTLVLTGNLEISGDLTVAGSTSLAGTSINGVSQVAD